jgi:hypothetical protein
MSKTGKGNQLRLRAIVTRDKMTLQLEKELHCVTTLFTVIFKVQLPLTQKTTH